MLMYAIKLSFFAVFSIAMAVAANHRLFFTDTGKRIIVFWVCIIPFIFIVRNEMLNMLVCSLLLYYLNGKDNSRIMAIVFFIAVLGAVPDWSGYIVSIPGVNYLIRLSFYKVAVLVLLLPIFLSLNTFSRVKWNLTDTLVCLFVIYTTLLAFRDGKVTTLMRFFVDSALIYIIPYFVFTRVIKSIQDLHYCALGFLFLSLLIAMLFVVSQAVKVDLYTEFNPYSSFQYFREYRSGFLRLSGPFNGVLSGFVLLSGYLSLEVLKENSVVKRIPCWMFFLVCVLCVMFGGSRAALFGFMLGVGIYFYFVKLTGTKRILFGVLFVLLLFLEFVFGLSAYFLYTDEYGTFDYRVEVYRASWEFLKFHLFFGSETYLQSGYFDHLVTGLGIVDIVSAYLQIALRYGAIGLLLFLGMYLSVLIPLVKYLFVLKKFTSDFAKYVVMYFALNIVLMFIISTTSMISLFAIFIVMNIAIGRVVFSSKELRAQV
ncbi:MAG: hypothetical protein ACI9D5_000299 [Candidatus Endobugula sp.]|jgi:hypothetical protein